MTTIANNAMQTQMVLHICGAERGIFKGEDGKEIQYGSVYGGQALSGENAVGFKVDKYKAEAHVFDVVKSRELPAQFLCRVNVRQMGPTGQSIRIMDAVPFDYQPPKAGK